MTTENRCDPCGLCCKVMRVDSIDKPANEWCEHYSFDIKGCSRYANKPQECTDFKCVWLHAEETGRSMGKAMRPDRCKAVICTDDNPSVIVMLVDPNRPDAIKEGALCDFIDNMVNNDIAIAVTCGKKRRLICSDRDLI